MRSLAHPAAVAALALAAACGEPTGGDPTPPTPPPPPATPAITSVSLTAGGAGVITGTDLDALPTTLTVDGQSVAVASKSATEVRFTLPQLRPCETDGRPVVLAIGTLSRTAPLDVPGALELAAGQSRVLTREEMDACLELAAAPGLYVLTALHPATSAPAANPAAVDTLLEVRTWTYGAPPSAALASAEAPRGAVVPPTAHTHGPRSATATLVGSPFSENPKQFDPRYATAQAGDTVPFVDFSVTGCRDNPATATTYPVRILAAHGKALVALDLRMANNSHLLTSEALARFASLAARVDSVMVPAARMVFGIDYQPPQGFGGRYVMLLNTRTRRGEGGGIGPDPKTTCPMSSEDVVGTYGIFPEFTVTDQSIAMLAGVFTHEYGHAADYVMGKRNGPSDIGSEGFTREAWAEQTTETASRLLSGRLPTTSYDAAVARIQTGFTHDSYYGRSSTLSPFTGLGRYSHGSTILLYARELTGEAFNAASTPTLYQRLMALRITHNLWSVAHIAQQVEKTPEQFMDEWSLALATDGFAPADSPLPAFRTWEGVRTTVPNIGSRTTSARHVLATGVGNYAALYFGDQGAEAGQGVSLQFSRVSQVAFKARLTRTR